MTAPGADALLFFAGHERAFPLYLSLHERLCAACPEAAVRVQKTQITYGCPRVFACVSFARVKRRSELPEEYLVLTLGLNQPLHTPRVAVKTEPYPGRWTHHIVLSREEELDAELMDCIAQAVAFARARRRASEK